MKKRRTQRFYTDTSFKIMKRTRIIILFITSPLWFPLYGFTWLFYHLSEALDTVINFLDDLLQKFLDKIIPQKDDKMILCLTCDFLFKNWEKVAFNDKKVCPVCGISKELKQYKIKSM